MPAVTRTFNRPIIWSIEIAQLLFAWLAFLGANQAMRAGAHIGVDLLTRNLPPPIRRAVALFNLAGHLMNATGITRRLLAFASALTGWMAGGLAHTSIVLSALMGGISGSSVADASMEARILGPTMRRHGYAGGFTAAVIALSSLITSTIPPSIGLILYGFIGQVSVGRLFLAGVVPGILMTAVLMGPAYLISRRRGYRGEIAEPPRRARGRVTGSPAPAPRTRGCRARRPGCRHR